MYIGCVARARKPTCLFDQSGFISTQLTVSGSGLNVQQTDVKAARALILSNACSGQTMVQPTVPMSDAGAMAMGDGTASQLLVLQTLSASCELDEISNVVNSSGTMPEKTAAPVALSAIIVDDSMLYSFSAASRPVGPGIRSPLSLIMNTVDVAHQLIASGALDDFFLLTNNATIN